MRIPRGGSARFGPVFGSALAFRHMRPLVIVEDTAYVLSDLIAGLLFVGLAYLVFVLTRRVRRDRHVAVDEEMRVRASADEVVARITTALRNRPKTQIERSGPWQFDIVVKHMHGPLAVLGLPGVVLASIARATLVLHVALFQAEHSVVVVRMWGSTELAVRDALHAQLDPGAY